MCSLDLKLRFVNMIAMALQKLEGEQIWTHIKTLRKEYYKRNPAVWPDKCFGFFIKTGLKWSESLI